MPRNGACEIVLVSSGHPALDQRVFDKEAVSLARAFRRVRVVAPHPADEMRNGVHITALPPYGSRWSRFLLRPIQGLLAARGRGARVLILQDAELLFWVPFLKLFTGWRIIYDAHEDFPQLLLTRTWIPAPLRRVVSGMVGIWEKFSARMCDGVTGATGSLIEYFAHRHRLALYNLPSRAFLDEVSLHARPLAERQYDVVHLGTLAEEGRLEFLITMLDSLFVRKPEARALIIGVRTDQERVISEHFSAERVTVLGKIPYTQVAAYLGDCRVGLNVFPTLHPHLRCAVPVKIFEYMAAGCAIVTSYLPELQRLVGDEGAEHMTVIYTPEVERFVDETMRLLDEPETTARHSTEMMRLVRSNWNWDVQAEQLAQFVTEVVDKQHAAPDTRTQDEPTP